MHLPNQIIDLGSLDIFNRWSELTTTSCVSQGTWSITTLQNNHFNDTSKSEP